MNLRYLFEIISAGTPKNLTALSKKRFATKEALRAPSLTRQVLGLQYLVNQSKEVKIALHWLQKGRSMIKSTLQDTNLPFGIGNGYNKLGGDQVEDYFC